MPTLESAVEQVKIGELTSVRGSEPVIGATDQQARGELLKAQRANDREGSGANRTKTGDD